MRRIQWVPIAVAGAVLAALVGCGGSTVPVVPPTRPVTFPAFALADSNRNTPTYGRSITRDSLLSRSFVEAINPGSRATQASVVYFGWST